MSKAYCIDVSGSVMDEEISKALDFVEKGIEPGDFVIAFDCRAKVIDTASYRKDMVWGRGGSDATSAFNLAKEKGAYQTILISDGYLSDGQIELFSKFIDIRKL